MLNCWVTGSKKGKKRKKGEMISYLFCASCLFCFPFAVAGQRSP